MKYYDYYEYFFQKNNHREPSPMITTTPPPPYPKKGYLPTPKPPPDIGRGLNRSYSLEAVAVIAHATKLRLFYASKMRLFYSD